MEHRPPSHDIIHAPSLEQIGFEEYEPPEGFCPLWRSYRGEGETSGSFHILAPSDRWQIAIHDFTLLHDTVMEFELPEYLSVAWYESISGEEFTPYRRLRAKSIWGFYSGDGGWRGLVHGGVPVKAVSIEVRPEMSRAYLEREYDGQFERVRDAFASLSDDGDSPELRALLAGLWPRPGDEHRSQLYYEGKVFEAMGLIVERTKARRDTSGRAVAPEDRERIQAFEGTVIAKKHGGVAETFTVRRVAYGVGIERVFPVNSPFVEKVTVVRKGKVRRAKLFYLRGRTGKAAKVKSDI